MSMIKAIGQYGGVAMTERRDKCVCSCGDAHHERVYLELISPKDAERESPYITVGPGEAVALARALVEWGQSEMAKQQADRDCAAE